MSDTNGEQVKKRNLFIRHKKLFIILGVVIIVVVVALVIFSRMFSAGAGAIQMPQTTTLSKTDLEQIVSGTGTLQSTDTREVSSSLSYDITELLVSEGDAVTKGQTLARLDSSKLDKDIADIQQEIADAEASDALSLSQANRKLQNAIEQRDIDEAQAAKDEAKALDDLNTAIAERDDAKTKLNEKKSAQKSAEKALSKYPAAGSKNFNQAEYEKLTTELQTAQTEYQSAEQTYETKKNTADQAQTSYDQTVQSRATTWRANTLSIENAQDTVDSQSMMDSTSSLRTQLEGYLEDKADCTITAPIAGTVTAMTAKAGQSAGGTTGVTGSTTDTSSTSSALFTIEKTNKLEMTASIPEYDAVTLTTGMQAVITTDALTGEEWSGKVTSISPKATDDNGNFTVVVQVTSDVTELAIGMSVKVNIITKSETDVFAVPYDAVTTNEAGESIIYVLSEGTMAQDASGASPARQMPANMSNSSIDSTAISSMGDPIVVETGMETDYYIEIQSPELKEGMRILSDPEGKNVDTGTGAGGFMMGGF